MPLQKQKRADSIHHKKRRGQHHAQGKHYLKVYWPYVPMALIVVLGLVLGNWRPAATPGVLAYATSMSINSLLSSTNSQRSANGIPGLGINSQLNAAAQAKANDMTARDYWSHNTPEGNAPWTFMDNAGYDYQKAGENLAYGFDSGADTITGWMNSPGHKANMLDSGFTEVGFGFANSANFTGSGPETVVVAMYGKPQVASAQTPAPAPVASSPPQTKSAAPTTQQTPTNPQTTQPSPAPAEARAPSDTPVDQPTTSPNAKNAPVTTQTPLTKEPTAIGITRAQTLTGSQLPWLPLSIGLVSGLALAIVALKHGLAFRRLVTQGEAFIIHHPWADITLVGLVMFGYVLSQTAGVIR